LRTSTLTSLLTQAIKTLLNDGGKHYSSNVIVLLVSIVTGAGGVGTRSQERVDLSCIAVNARSRAFEPARKSGWI